ALYGEIVPIPQERVLTTEDGQQLSLAGRTFRVLHTPGHALHHHCFFDEQYRNVFTGDTFGLSYRELDNANGAFIMPTTTPTQFDPDQLIASIDRIVALAPEAVYLTHYSRVTDIPRLAESLRLQIRAFEDIARRNATAADPKEAIRREMAQLWQRMLRERGNDLSPEQFNDLLGNDLELNSQGLIAWLERIRR
ncbi:MAG TPA: MBL fold metallo-hydrolase, partial [Steroidobacteraceae bacterium]